MLHTAGCPVIRIPVSFVALPRGADAMQVDASQPFGGLSSEELRHLREWQVSAMAIGIDAVEDLTSRPWPCPVSGTVIGVFTAGSKAARWLVVANGAAWAVASCSKGDVSRTLNSLAEALAVIHPGERATGPAAEVTPERHHA